MLANKQNLTLLSDSPNIALLGSGMRLQWSASEGLYRGLRLYRDDAAELLAYSAATVFLSQLLVMEAKAFIAVAN